MHAATHQLLHGRDAEVAVRHAGGDDDRPRAQLAAADGREQVLALLRGQRRLAQRERLDLPAREEPGAEADGLRPRPLRQPHPGDAAGEPEVVADHRARAGLAADGLGLEHDRAEALAGRVDRGGQAGRPGADHRDVDDALDDGLARRAVHHLGHLAHRRGHERRPVRARDHRLARLAAGLGQLGEHLAADVAVGVVHPRGQAHPLGEVAHGRRERVARARHDAHRLDLGPGHGGAPVRQQLDDRGVELLVAQAARHEQERVELAVGQARPQLLRALEERLPGHGHHAAGGGHDPAPGGERRPHVGVGQRRVLHQQRHLAAVGAQPLEQGGGVGARADDPHVVVAVVAAELVVEERGVLVARQHDHGVVHDTSLGTRPPWLDRVGPTGYRGRVV